jgi:hypothetical protein
MKNCWWSRYSALLLVCLVAAVSGWAQEAGARILYTKVFPGSQPAYQQISLTADGNGVYKEAEDDPNPVEFQLPGKIAAEVFSLAEELQFFGYKLESGLKIAKMGEKTFRYEGKVTQQQTFNYSNDLTAQKLQQIFEKMAESQRLFIRLEYSLKFDRLGINDALLAIDAAQRHDRLLGASHFLPLLDQVVNGKRYMNISRNRADAIARTIRQSDRSGAQ